MIAKTNKPKTIIAVWHKANKGKTETLRAFAKLLIARNHIPIDPIPAIVPDKDDFRLIIEIRGVRIGIESGGDPNQDVDLDLQRRLLSLANEGCNIIVCTARLTRGNEIFEQVDFVANEMNYETIWTSTYETPNLVNHVIINEIKATHIWDLLVSLGLIQN